MEEPVSEPSGILGTVIILVRRETRVSKIKRAFCGSLPPWGLRWFSKSIASVIVEDVFITHSAKRPINRDVPSTGEICQILLSPKDAQDVSEAEVVVLLLG